MGQITPSDFGVYQMPVMFLMGAGIAVLAILRWRDKDVRTITETLEKKLNDEWRGKYDALEARLKELESKLAHIENGSRTATMKAVEIKATSAEPRSMALAQEIIDALSSHPPAPPVPVV